MNVPRYSNARNKAPEVAASVITLRQSSGGFGGLGGAIGLGATTGRGFEAGIGLATGVVAIAFAFITTGSGSV
ncbi:MAG: hypothetical protein ABI986_08540 [Chloroflexota bacterium]